MTDQTAGWEPPKQRMACPKCRGEFDGSPNFCPHCGLPKAEAAALQGQPAQATPPPPDRFSVRQKDRSAAPTNPDWRAEAKKLTPWWRHPVMIVMYVLFGLILVGSLAGDGGSDGKSSNDREFKGENAEQREIARRCDELLDAFVATGPHSKDEQLEFYTECLEDRWYAEVGD